MLQAVLKVTSVKSTDVGFGRAVDADPLVCLCHRRGPACLTCLATRPTG